MSTIRLVDEEHFAEDIIQRLKTVGIIPPYARMPITIDINELSINISFEASKEELEET